MIPVKVVFQLDAEQQQIADSETEFLFCLPTGEGMHIVDNIPFFVREISLGDVIRTQTRGKKLCFAELVIPSRNSTLHIFVRDAAITEEVRAILRTSRCDTEEMEGRDLLAVSMPPDANAAAVLAFLDKETGKGTVAFEESAVRYR